MKKPYRIVLAGNPNCGKTCIFNALTGARQHVGNYAGVTVESKSGRFGVGGVDFEIVDLPGIYSLSSGSPEEEVAFGELTAGGTDLILNVVDSTILRRSLYLTTQLAELGIPMLIVLNMSDEADREGLKFDIPKLEKYFGASIVRTTASKSGGVKPLLDRLADFAKAPPKFSKPMLSYGADLDDEIARISEAVEAVKPDSYSHIPSRFFAVKLLESDGYVGRIPEFSGLSGEVARSIEHLSAGHAIEADTFIADRRYALLAGACRDAVSQTTMSRGMISDKIDVVLTNRFFGLPLFFLIMYATFWFTFTFAEPFMDWIEGAFAWLSEFVRGFWPEDFAPYLCSLLTDGVIGGVGGVLVFLPNILFLFIAIALLEESGYMSRAAFVMDGLMRTFGLQGRSFVPLILGFGCNVPAIMATRTIESEQDRKITIMVLPLMSCGARLPIYALIIPAFFAAQYHALMMFLIYVIGIVIALIAARLMKNTLFKGDGEVYLMELPPYRIPTLRSLLFHMWDRAKMYVHKAGTIILAASIVLFFANTFPVKKVFSTDYDAQIAALEKTPGSEEKIAALENQKSAESLEYTISGRVGRFLEPVFKPIGFDWKLTTASIGALAAKEVFVSQLGILYAEGESDEESESLRERLASNYTPLQGFCIMLFSLLSIPCFATLAIIRRELNSRKAALLEALALFALAYVVTLIVYQTGVFFDLGNKLIQ